MISYKNFLILMIAIPIICFLSIITLNYIVDPYNLNNKFNIGMDKEKISYKANYRLYKIQEFNNNPCENILLGDSRIDGLNTSYIEKLTGDKYFNFAYGGGTLYEVIDTFWYAADRQKLKRVYIGINFNLYNEYNKFNLVPEAKETLSNPWKYYTSIFITKISFYNILYKCFNINLVSEKPVVNKDEFWRHQLNESTYGFYNRYKYPESLYTELIRIKSYCDRNNIELIILIPPTHIDLQKMVEVYNLSLEYQKYKNDINGLGKVYDFDIDNEMNRNKDLYLDPYHGSDEIKNFMIDSIWKK